MKNKKKRLLALKLAITLIILLNTFFVSYGQQNDSTATDTLQFDYSTLDYGKMVDSLGTPSLSIAQQDSLYIARKDSLRRDSIARASSMLTSNYLNRKRKYVPLPSSIILTFTDSALIKAEHYLAIEDYFLTTFKKTTKKTILSVLIGKKVEFTTAYVRALPLLQAEYEEKKQTRFVSNQELSSYKEKQMEYFDAVVDIVMDIKSEFIAVTELDTSLFAVQLLIDEFTVKPIRQTLLPLNSYITEFIPWYERRIILSFPRYHKGEDIWFERNVALTIQLMNPNMLPDTKYQTIFRFDMNHDLRIDPKEALNSLNSN
ncbi:MAG: hypothetical protein GW823_07095 [Bacteroidetes bacterium]|nr:hypothetical protein [Bacteroidota bacterium]